MHIDHDFLMRYGICMEGGLEEEMFLELLNEKNEILVGQWLMDNLTEEEQGIFDSIEEDEVLLAFLNEHVPGYMDAIQTIEHQLGDHLVLHREVYARPLEVDRVLAGPIPGQSSYVKILLARASLDTVGSVLALTVDELAAKADMTTHLAKQVHDAARACVRACMKK